MPYKIVEKEELAKGIYHLRVEAPQIATNARPGQFMIIRIHERGERIPLTIADYGSGSVSMVFLEIGKTTRELATLEEGDYILDVVGPLGRPSKIENFGTVVLVGGGVGIAPIYPQAKAFRDVGNRVISIIGARTRELLFWEERMRSVSDQVLVATDDGSLGHHGFVTDLLKEVLEKGRVDRVVAIGPPVMMRAVAGVTAPFKVPTIVSLNPIMVDGTGMCGSCRVLVGNETKFACVDGPEFDAHLVDFTLLMNRLNLYREEEQVSLEKYCGGGECKC